MVRSVPLSVTETVQVTPQLIPLQFSGNFIELAILFVILAIIAAVVGARDVAGISMAVAKWFVIIFLVLAILSVVF